MTEYRIMPTTDDLPYALYTAAQVRHFDDLAINHFGISGYELMGRAGRAAFDVMMKRWPDAKAIHLVCGSGNNAGDGFVVALQAQLSGLNVTITELGDYQKMSDETRRYRDEYLRAGGIVHESKTLPKLLDADVLVDALLGTGLNAPVKGDWAEAIEAINRFALPIMSLDLPSGLHADSGQVLGSAIRADLTVTFIGLKQGLFTAEGKECSGEIFFNALDIPAKIYASEILSCRRIDWQKLKHSIALRSRASHKGDFGHVLIVGGNAGFSGAARLSAEAALRSGAGLVSVATRASQASTLNLGRPEIMVHAVESADSLRKLLGKVSVVVLGPGLGKDDWAKSMYETVITDDRPLVLDADGLNLFSEHPVKFDNRPVIMTPHPGEAGRLLNLASKAVNCDRFESVRKLQQKYGCTVVLKGAGTLIASPGNQPLALCSEGNPGMASGGMGDVLAGIAGTMLAQNEDVDLAACQAVSLHSAAADRAAEEGEIGLLASDLFSKIRSLINAA
jgi:ADP-dependent NAD(P)H-hydrate dehydratase / NAD(P)H-hydrate epimerase